jgi:putative RNA 2'-phosphotransferase
MTNQSQRIKRNAKFISYVLGHHPDEFGLLPDENGFVKIKNLIKALQEEPGWRFLRSNHLHELMISLQPAPIEIDGLLVRATDRRQLPSLAPTAQLPKLLYSAIRRRAYPVVLEQGLQPAGEGYVMLTSAMAMAIRLGHRIDNDPVILTVQTITAQKMGANFNRYGTDLYLADAIPSGTFSGPPLARERQKPDRSAIQSKLSPPASPGSYFPDMTQLAPKELVSSQLAGKKEKKWQIERRQARKHKTSTKIWPK